jgi:hypothetical protein
VSVVSNGLPTARACPFDPPEELGQLRDEDPIQPMVYPDGHVGWLVTGYRAAREVLQDVDLDGHPIKAGQTVTVSLPAANRDPKRYPDPNRLDITREAGGHLAFGHGIHQCLGQQLARIEMRIGFPALLNRFPNLRLAASPSEIPTREDMSIYGVHQLPVEDHEQEAWLSVDDNEGDSCSRKARTGLPPDPRRGSGPSVQCPTEGTHVDRTKHTVAGRARRGLR